MLSTRILFDWSLYCQYIFFYKLLKAFFLKVSDKIARNDVQNGDGYQNGVQQTDSGKILEWSKMGYAFIFVIQHFYGDIFNFYPFPCSAYYNFYFKFKLFGIKFFGQIF